MSEVSYKTEIINERELYVPEIGEWEEILANKEFVGIPVRNYEGWDKWINYRLELAKKYSELMLALYQSELPKFSFSPIILLRIENNLQRVHIEHLECDICRWYGATANPMLSELYIGTPDLTSALKAAERYIVQSCPRCRSKLLRHPIWVEPLSQE